VLCCAAPRIYNQNKGDASVHQHSCVVFTTGAAIVTLLRWLCDVRHKVGNDSAAFLRERVVFCLQKGKASRVEQPSGVICEAVRALLAGHGSPFKVDLVDTTTQLEAAGSELVAWLHSPAFAPLAFLVHANRWVAGWEAGMAVLQFVVCCVGCIACQVAHFVAAMVTATSGTASEAVAVLLCIIPDAAVCLFAVPVVWCSVRRLSVEQLIAEDAALEKSCTDALSFVRTCEQLRGYNKQVQPGPVSGHTAGWVTFITGRAGSSCPSTAPGQL
jgi:hypothetical protein